MAYTILSSMQLLFRKILAILAISTSSSFMKSPIGISLLAYPNFEVENEFITNKITFFHHP